MVLSGRDLTEILADHQLATAPAVRSWLEQEFPPGIGSRAGRPHDARFHVPPPRARAEDLIQACRDARGFAWQGFARQLSPVRTD